MGFFFSKQKSEIKKRVAKSGLRQAPATKQNAEILERLGCKACPLDKADVCTPKMQPILAERTDIYFLGEAPDKEDDVKGLPFTGADGQILRQCIKNPKYCSFDNVVRDHTPKNRAPAWAEIQSCKGHISDSIVKAKPKLIVGLGIAPLQWMLNSSDISGLRGRAFAVSIKGHPCWFMPTYSPSFIRKKAFNKQAPLKSNLGHCLKMDINRAFSLLDTLPEAKVDTPYEARANVQCFDGSKAGDLGRVLALISEARKARIKAVDIETYPLRPYATESKILTIAFSYKNVNFSFSVDHPKSKFTKEQRQEILDATKLLLSDNTTKVAHNAPFEIEWFVSYFGKEIVKHEVWACTMMQAHFIDERRGDKGKDDDGRKAPYQKLDFLCRQHFGIAYKSLFKLDKKDMRNADLGETLIYNAVDTKYTLKLYFKQKRIIENESMLEAYQEAILRQPTVALMQYLGISVNQKEVLTAQKKLSSEIDEITSKIMNLKVVKAYVKENKSYNPDSGPETITIFRDYLKRPEIKIIEDGKEKYSVDKNVLDKIDHPLADLLKQKRNRSKLKSTYVDPFEQGAGECIWPDNKIHTSFNTTFAETGRLSSDSPNQQNWAKRNDAWVRRQIVAGKNHVILAFDYGQLEGCTSAMCTKDKALIKALWENYDIHMDWAIKIGKRYPERINGVESLKDKDFMKKWRSIVKNKWTFPIIFGASIKSLSSYLNIPEEVITKLVYEFLNEFIGLDTWQKTTMKFYYDHGYVVSPTGRKHRYPLTRNQVVNFPIQSVAADIVCDAMNTLSYVAITTEQWHLHPILNIHDDLTFIIPDNDKIIEESIEIIYKIMLSPPFKFVNVPLSVECSIGTNWFEMKEVGKFWSNKDL